MPTNDNTITVEKKNKKNYSIDRESIIHALLDASKTNCKIYFKTENQNEIQLSYKDIYYRSLCFSDYIKKNGLKKGDKVVILLSTCPEFLFSFYGTLMAGGIPVTVAPPQWGLRDLNYYLLRLNSIFDNCKAEFITTFGSEYLLFSDKIDSKIKNCIFIDLNHIDFNIESDSDYYLPNSRDICFIQYTSGSTGNPKGVPLTHENIIANINGIGNVIKADENDSGMSWMPLYHDMGLIGGLFLPMHYSFKTMAYLSPFLFANPLNWLKYMTEHQTTISPGNNFAYNYCVKKISEDDKLQLDLSAWRVAFNGSEPIDINIIKAFYEKFKSVGYNKTAMLACYGLAEGTLGVTFSDVDEAPSALNCNSEKLYLGAQIEIEDKNNSLDKDFIQLISLGKPINCLKLKIVDSEDNELLEGYVGRIIIKGDSVMYGYYNIENTSIEQPFLNEWLITGDIGFVYDGNLYCTGREKELIIIRGKNHSAVDIENIIKQTHDIKANCVVFSYMSKKTNAETFGVVIESKEQDTNIIEELKNSIQKTLLKNFEIRAEIINIVPPKTIPKTFNGKTRRLDCAKLFSLN